MANSAQWQKMISGEDYWAGDEDLQANRTRCKGACEAFNAAGSASRRKKVELWRRIVGDERPMPPEDPDPARDAAQFDTTDPVVDGPVSVDHGINFKVAPEAFLNFGLVVLDTCLITVGARTLFGPNVSLYGASHPIDPKARNGLKGPESGKPIHIEEDCWIGGGAIILPGVTIGRGSTIGAGAVVSRSIPSFSLAVGNPAKVVRKVESEWDTESARN